MSRRSDVVGLDDLFGETEPAASEPSRRRIGRRWLLGRAFFAVTLGTVIYGFLWIVRVSVPYPLIVGTIFVITVLRAALLHINVRPLPAELTGRGLASPADPVVATEVDAEEARTPDGLQVAVGRWESRLNHPARDADRLTRVVQPRLRELVDERLRLRHGYTLASDPERARRRLGESTWKMIHEPPPRGGFPPRDLAALVDQMEAL
ncbi:MAG TPA: hypothetical protein VK453_10680 [Micromonosporaceae bacterium]|nr:hypothetical protein [Micromonosporaceae bacterium]